MDGDEVMPTQAQFKLSRPFSLAITGQNPFDRAHAEYTSGTIGLTATDVPRSAAARLTWTF
jgi:hypothetical protein